MRVLNFTLLFLAALLFFASCKLDKPILPGDPGYVKSTPPGGGSTGTGGNNNNGAAYGLTGYIKGTLNGTAFDWEVTNPFQNWAYNYGGVSYGNTQNTYIGDLQGDFSSLDASNQQSISISFHTFQVDSTKGDSAAIAKYFYSFLTTGSWNYSLNHNYVPDVKQVSVMYTDPAGNIFSTEEAPQPQANATFNVLSVTKLSATPYQSDGLEVNVSFSCTLYSAGSSGKSVTFNNVTSKFDLEDLLHHY